MVVTLISIYTPVYPRLVRWFGCLPNLFKRYSRMSGSKHFLRLPTIGHPTEVRGTKSTTHTPCFLGGKYGTGGKSKHRLDWKQSSQLHYWIEDWLSNSITRFRKFFRVTHTRFDETDRRRQWVVQDQPCGSSLRPGVFRNTSR